MNYSTENNKKRKKTYKNNAVRVKNKIAVFAFRTFMVALLVGGFALAGTLAGAYIGILESAPNLGAVQELSLDYTSVLYDANGDELDRLDGGENREYATSEQIPQHVKDAFVSIEDERFYEHDGVDYKGFVRATVENISAMGDENSTLQGASTITQQLIKNKIGLKRNSIVTKLQEQHLAIKYEKDLIAQFGNNREKAKDYILELYLNIIGLGDGQNGVQAAAQHYFGKDISEVTLEEACIIAAITQNPTYNNPFRDPVKNSKRAQTALDKMLELGFITQAEYDAADLNIAYETVKNTKAAISEQPSFHSYYVDQVIEDVIKDLRTKNNWTRVEASNYVYRSGLQIYTNYDPKIQAIVDAAYMDDKWFPGGIFEVEILYTLSTRNELTNKVTHHPRQRVVVKSFDAVEAEVEKLRDKLLGPDDIIDGELIHATPQPQGAFAIIDQYTGKVAALSGGRGEKLTDRAFNRATAAERHPGSVFKVLASYVPALDMGLITPATVIDDVPYTYAAYDNYAPKNWWGSSYRGLSTVRNGIRNSMNGITVKNMYDTGVENCFNYLLNFGFSTLSPSDATLSTSLGGLTTGVTVLETAAAYAAIANGGLYIKPTLYSQVLDHDGNIILDNTPETRQVIKRTTAYLTTHMMMDVITSGTGTQARFQNVKMPIAGKTGTSTATKDLTFAGYTPYYTAAVWLGFDMPKEMNNPGNKHLEIWRHIMEEVHKDLAYREFERPTGITSATVCNVSGLLAVNGLCTHDPRGSRTRTELFAAGTEPTQPCDVHQEYEICTLSNKVAGPYCQEEFVEKRIGIVRKEPFTGTAAVEDAMYEVPKAILEGGLCDRHLTTPTIVTPEIPETSPTPGIVIPIIPTNPPDYHPTEAPTDPPMMETPPPDPTPTPGRWPTTPDPYATAEPLGPLMD